MEPASSAPQSRTGMVRGTILAESLKPGTVLDGAGMQIICWSRYQVTGVAAYQPAVWTAIEFEAPEEIAPALRRAFEANEAGRPAVIDFAVARVRAPQSVKFFGLVDAKF